MSRVLPSACPRCRTVMDAARNMTGKRGPAKDDLTVCFYCSAPLQFNADLSLRLMTRKDFDALPSEAQQDLLRVVRSVRAYRSA